MAIICADLETDGYFRQTNKILCIGIGDYQTREVTMYHGDDIPFGLERMLDADKLFGHNFLGFDIPVMEKLYKQWDIVFDRSRVWDTLAMSRLYFPERTADHSNHGLEAWGKTLGFPKGNHKDFSRCTPELIEYCKNDVILNMRVMDELLTRFSENETNGYLL